MKNSIQDKNKLVNSVFSRVYKKYDFMNDIMSLEYIENGKKKFIDWMNPQPNTKLIDVASGTGDIANLYLEKLIRKWSINGIEPNKEMLSKAKLN